MPASSCTSLLLQRGGQAKCIAPCEVAMYKLLHLREG